MLNHMPPPPARRDYRIGVIGAGFIVRDVQLVAYAKAEYHVAAIASADPRRAREVAELRGIPRVWQSVEELLGDDSIDILDIAVPPHAQPPIIHRALERRSRIRGILAQKPLALGYRDAAALVRECEQAGVMLAVNQNMRYDQSVRALKTLLSSGDLGETVLGTIDMRAIPHWQPWVRDYNRLTLAVMSIHHLDTFRYWFGDPESVYASARPDPRTQFPHRDGVVFYILEYANGMRAAAWDDVWTGPAREGAASDAYIKWRVEGTQGFAQGFIGWPSYPNLTPSTIEYSTTREPGRMIRPQWSETWFPDAFAGTMGELMDALANARTPAINGRENLGTIALVEACYRSLDEHRPVCIAEIKERSDEARTH
jgi:predicted dehydrogenase